MQNLPFSASTLWPGATVEPFGSFVSNLFTRWGDVDISIELPNGLHISAAGKKYKLSLLGDVLKALRAKGMISWWMPFDLLKQTISLLTSLLWKCSISNKDQWLNSLKFLLMKVKYIHNHLGDCKYRVAEIEDK